MNNRDLLIGLEDTYTSSRYVPRVRTRADDWHLWTKRIWMRRERLGLCELYVFGSVAENGVLEPAILTY